MATRCTTHFTEGAAEPCAIIYRHHDGYPEGHGLDLYRFLREVKRSCAITRFNDPWYLAAKLVVFLARDRTRGDSSPLVFSGVGVYVEDPGDIDYRYTVDCSQKDEEGLPVVTCVVPGYDGKPDRQVPLTKPNPTDET